MSQWHEVPATDAQRAQGIRAFQKPLTGGKHLTALVGHEPDSKGVKWWHMSLSKRDNFNLEPAPVSYFEMQEARRYLLKPDRLFAEMFPPLDQWQPGDETPHVRHLWEIPSDLWD